jgi:peptidoglycan/xylan/chitin deacetylase (PgdA/CDA1 family)
MSKGKPPLCIKVDVDTLEGYLKGVPRLLEILSALGVRATFCVPMGPDNSGRAVRRLFTRRGFLSKMLRTRAASMYGWRTMLYGTILPGPMIAAAQPHLLEEIVAAGHELIPHGWDHVDWHDNLSRWGLMRTREELHRACQSMEAYTRRPCLAFAAPGWQATPNSLRAERELGLRYASDTRGWRPFFPVVEGEVIEVMQVPTTLPTLDELIGRRDLRNTDLVEYMLKLIWHSPRPLAHEPAPTTLGTVSEAAATPCPTGAHVFTIHAEVEGRAWAGWVEKLLREALNRGAEFLTLSDLREKVIGQGSRVLSEVVDCNLPGRAGRVSCQASQPAPP